MKRLIPSFILNDYDKSYTDALDRNCNGLCGFKDCNNPLGEKPESCFAIKICAECHIKINKIMTEIVDKNTKG